MWDAEDSPGYTAGRKPRDSPTKASQTLRPGSKRRTRKRVKRISELQGIHQPNHFLTFRLGLAVELVERAAPEVPVPIVDRQSWVVCEPSDQIGHSQGSNAPGSGNSADRQRENLPSVD